jgi:hypothetical protein
LQGCRSPPVCCNKLARRRERDGFVADGSAGDEVESVPGLARQAVAPRARQLFADFPRPNAVWVGRARRLKLRPLFGTLCAVLVIIRDLKHHLLGYFVLHIIGKTARFVGAFAPGTKFLSRDRRRSLALRLHAFTHFPQSN